MRLTDIPVERPVATIMLLLSLVVLGVVAVFLIPLGYFPTVKEPEIDIEVPFPGSHPLEAIREVAMPLEEELATIPGVKSLFSNASAGRANLTVVFDWSENIDLKKMEVRDAVERARPVLPESVEHIRVEVDTDGPMGGAILQGRISAKRDLSESWELLDRRIRRRLERVRGVARVDLYGVLPQELWIELDLDALVKHGVDPGDLITRLNQANLDMDLGSVRGDLIRYDVRSVARFRDLESIRALRLNERGVRVGDVAKVSLSEPRLGYGRHLDGHFAIGLDVFKEPSANTVETVDRLMARIAEVEADPELQGVNLLIWDNAGERILSSLRGLRNAGAIGGLLAIVVLYFFLRRWQTTLVVAVAIPFSLLVTCGAMYLLGSDFNVLTLLGLMLGVGMLVDNAVVVMENIHRLQARGIEAREAARQGVRQVFMAVVASTATTIIVWSWLFAVDKSPMTIYMGSVALTICLAVLCSLLISVTFIPLVSSRIQAPKPGKRSFLIRRVLPGYRALLGWTLRHRVITLLLLFALAGSAWLPISKIEKKGNPRSLQTNVRISYEVFDQAPKEVHEAYISQVEAWLESRKEEFGFSSIYSIYSEMWNDDHTNVFLPEGEASEAAIERLTKKLEADLPVIPGIKLSVGDPQWWRGGQDDSRTRVAVALHGDDPEYLVATAERLEAWLEDLPDADEVSGPMEHGQKEIRIVVDPDKTRELSLTPRAIADTVAFAFRGRRLRRFEGAHGEVEMMVRLPEDARPGLAALELLPIPRAGQPSVNLSAVARIELAKTLPNIRRENRKTTIWVSVRFAEDSINTQEARALVSGRMAGFHLPEGYSWDFGEWGRREDEALTTMTIGVSLALVIVVLLMMALFESFLQPLAILVTLPLAFFGAFWILWLAGYRLDVIAFMGLIILIGIVVNNGIVMVDHVNSLRRSGKPRVEALIEGCGDRLRPVIMTATTTVCGLIPLAFSDFVVVDVLIDSLAVAVIGGLVSSTIFTLIALPVWYTTVEDFGSVIARLFPRLIRGSRFRLPRGGVLE